MLIDRCNSDISWSFILLFQLDNSFGSDSQPNSHHLDTNFAFISMKPFNYLLFSLNSDSFTFSIRITQILIYFSPILFTITDLKIKVIWFLNHFINRFNYEPIRICGKFNFTLNLCMKCKTNIIYSKTVFNRNLLQYN